MHKHTYCPLSFFLVQVGLGTLTGEDGDSFGLGSVRYDPNFVRARLKLIRPEDITLTHTKLHMFFFHFVWV